ncbi:cellulose biosynthesis protein BcsO [Citrobacter braakii]|uniref:cellulose biosynthesis protein BcsO n=1 Tax=Citrobacter braakii TaxID=57706 RepID=UPI002B28C87B|nr:cellulose biosynthesis protein BcsO [Citrobacter braakii]
MNHFDDLQRFKDKTRNQKNEFKDLSAQNLSPDHGSWAIMNQLAPATEESKLAMGGHVSLPQPQAVAPDVFASDERHERVESIDTIDSIESAETSTETSTESVLPPVDTDLPAVTAPSIFREVAGQLASQSAAPVAPSAQPAANPVVPTTTTAPAPSATAPADYSRLFATKAPEAKPTVEKNQPLQSLLERIASCR